MLFSPQKYQSCNGVVKGMINNKISEISPYHLSILCGLLSAAFSLSSTFLFNYSAFSLIFLVLSYFWLVPILFVSFLHGSKYGIIAGSILVGIDTLLAGLQASSLALCIHLLPALYFTHMVRDQSPSSPPRGLGMAFSRICLLYSGAMIFALTLVFDIGSLKETAASFLKALGPKDIGHITESFIHFFPGILCISSLISLIINVLATLKVLSVISPESRPYSLRNSLKIPGYWDIVFLGSLLPILTQHEMFAFIGKNVLLLSCLPLYLYGLGIVYSWLNRLENWNLWMFFILILSVVLVWPAMLVILLGLLEPILKIQKDTDKSS